MKYLVIPKCLGNIHGRLEDLELKFEEQKLEIPSNDPWDAEPTRAPKFGLNLQALARRAR